MYRNYYVHCQQQWSDDWDCMCNDRCPVCNHEIEPYMSEDLDENDFIMHVDSDFVPDDGWPKGVSNLEELKDGAV